MVGGGMRSQVRVYIDFRLFSYLFIWWILIDFRYSGWVKEGCLQPLRRGSSGQVPDGVVLELPTHSAGRGWGTHDPIPIRPIVIPIYNRKKILCTTLYTSLYVTPIRIRQDSIF